MKRRILIVEDDASMTRMLRDNLVFEGFEVRCLANGTEALNGIRSFAPDLVLLDIMLPGIDGFQICAAIGEGVTHTPVIILSARGESADKIKGLKLGADDYVTKPFNLDELLARVHAVMRRADSSPQEMQLGNLSVDFGALKATKAGSELPLTQREFEVLRLLWMHRGAVVTREQLLRTLWGYGDVPITRTVDHFVARLRSKIESDPHHPQYLQTVYGEGYRLITARRE